MTSSALPPDTGKPSSGPYRSRELRFAGFCLDLRSGELNGNGTKISLQQQPLEVLRILLEQAGEVVSREELRQRLWSADTFVDFDHGLNKAVQKLREALGDSATTPHFIETLPRRGYRFIAPLEIDRRGDGESAVESPKHENHITEAAVPSGRPVGLGETGRVRRWFVLGGVAALGLVAVGFVVSRSPAGPLTSPTVQSLAVLPLKNLSDEPGQQYLVDGLTDELTTHLAKLGSLRVIARTSAMFYRDTQKPFRQIAKELNVEAVVTGTVERSDHRVRVRTNLVRAGTDEILWAESYDRDLGDTLQLESEISQAIANELGIKLTAQAQQRLEKRETTNLEARDAYLRALYFFEKDDREGALSCLQNLQEATSKDRNYTSAYVLLPRCYDLAYDMGVLSLAERNSKIRVAVMKAAELDDVLGEVHSELADYYFYIEWNFDAAFREIKRALELDPNSSIIHYNHSFYLQRIGRADESIEEMRRARELDPLNLHIADSLASAFWYSRRYDEALNQFRSVLEMSPGYRRSRWGLVRTYDVKGMHKEAIDECHKILALPNIDPFTKALFERRCSLYEKVHPAFDKRGLNRRWFESGQREIKEAIELADDDYFIATLYAATSEHEKALDLLEATFVKHESSLLALKVDPRLDNLRPDPRFQALLHRMNFPE